MAVIRTSVPAAVRVRPHHGRAQLNRKFNLAYHEPRFVDLAVLHLAAFGPQLDRTTFAGIPC
jgi:hypothetical protein